MTDSNNKNNLGLFAIIFTAIFGTLFGIFKVAEKISASKGDGSEIDKIRRYVATQLLQGVDDKMLANALMIDAMQKLGSDYNPKTTQLIRGIVFEEKAKLKSAGKM